MISFAAIAPDILPVLLNSRRVVDRINAWSQRGFGDHVLEIEYRFGVPVKATKNPRYDFKGGGFVAQPRPWQQYFPGFGTIWVERYYDHNDGVEASKRFALHPDIDLDNPA